MATRTTVTFVDDVDGSTAGVERYIFSWLGADYSIDLAPKSAKKLLDVMNVYVEKATPIPKPRAVTGAVKAAPRTKKVRAAVKEVRSWAREQGLRVSDKGRMSEAVRHAYAQAH